jgi:hypothetical protein
MEHAKKMVVIDPRSLEQMQLKSQRIQEMSNLDMDMDKILHKDIPDHQKAQLYNQILQKYLTYKKQVTSPEAEEQKTSESSINNTETLSHSITDTVPGKFKRKAELLVNRLKQVPELTWNEKGEIIYKGNLQENSNITDLVNDVMRARKNFHPVGWTIFSNILKAANIPQDLIGNTKYISGSNIPTYRPSHHNQSHRTRSSFNISTPQTRHLSQSSISSPYSRPWFTL